MQTDVFTLLLDHDCCVGNLDEIYPSQLSSWSKSNLVLEGDATHFGYVHEGEAQINSASGSFSLSSGMYFSVPGECEIMGSGSGYVVSRLCYRGFFHVGGPIEETGRYQYIDGCTDSLLVPPVMKGDACLNLLHVPAKTNQTQHTHPSVRVGLIVEGEGVCRSSSLEVPLSSGTIFVIPTDVLHSFHTTNSHMKIVAYHPDSNFGPTDDSHPMVNRTIVNGQPIKQGERA